MSSIFGASIDESSVDSSADDSNIESCGPSSSQIHEELTESLLDGHSLTADTRALSLTEDTGALSRAIGTNFQWPNVQSQQTHSTLFYLSLIEARCRTQAAQSINARRRPDDQLLENHPEVLDLAEHLFAEMSKELHKAGILPNEYAGQNLASLRKIYLSSFDAILNNIAAKRNHDIPGHTSYEAIDNSGFFSMGRDADASSFEISRAIVAQNFTMTPRPTHYLLNGDNPEDQASSSEYVSKYQQLCLLGKGGFGHVYKVRDLLDDQIYAVKRIIIPSHRLCLINSEEKRAEVLKELRALAKLQHRNVVRYHHSWFEVFPSTSKSNTPNKAGETSSSSESESQSTSNIETQLGNLQLGIQRRFSKGTKARPRDLRRNESLDAMVVFEHSSPSDQAIGPHKGQKPNNPSKSMFRNPTKVDSDDSTEEIGRGDADSYLKEDVHLFIKMSVLPMTLEEYIWPDLQKSPDQSRIHHCFHSSTSARILSAILDGVEYIHSHRFIHRDLKPSNIFLSIHYGSISPEGAVDMTGCPQCGISMPNTRTYIIPHIGDFGLIAELKDREESILVAPEVGPVFESSPLAVIASRQPGTKFYCPPIMPRIQPIICPKLDVFSLGVITFEMITKFSTKSERAVVLDKLNKSTLPSDFEKHEMAAGVKGMVCADRDERWDCIRVRNWLRDIQTKYK